MAVTGGEPISAENLREVFTGGGLCTVELIGDGHGKGSFNLDKDGAEYDAIIALTSRGLAVFAPKRGLTYSLEITYKSSTNSLSSNVPTQYVYGIRNGGGGSLLADLLAALGGGR